MKKFSARVHYLVKIAAAYVLIFLGIVSNNALINRIEDRVGVLFLWLHVLFFLILIFTALFIWIIWLMVHRLRDSGRSGIWVIPYIGLVLSLGLYYLLSFLHRIQEEVNLVMLVFLAVAVPIVLGFLPVKRTKQQ